jgi:energy-coupling factor transport system permease protein
MKIKLFSYNQLNTIIHKMSGSSKLICFLLITSAVMFTYDPRIIIGILVFSFIMLFVAKISFKQIRPMLMYVFAFLLINFVLTYIISPDYGPKIYGTRTVLLKLFGKYDITQEQLLYQCTKTLKYFSAIPLGFIFFLTTNPSEFASSLNGIGVPYKACTALSLTLRYFPDVQMDFNDVSNAQQARGLDNSKKAKFKDRVVNTTKIIIPLIFSTLDRVESITNAMELRGYGKNNKRTWYSYRSKTKIDYIAMFISLLILLFSLYMRFFVVKSMYYNPFA